MVEISRRFFLGGALAATAAITVPLLKAMPLRPLLYGDGIHDDTAGLQAIFNGEQVDLVGDHVRLLQAERIEINGGVFRISQTLTLRRSSLTLANATLNWTSDFRDDIFPKPLFHLAAGDHNVIINNVMRV